MLVIQIAVQNLDTDSSITVARLRPSKCIGQDERKGGLSLRGVAVMTETAMTAETATVASLCSILQDKQKGGKVLSRTAKTVKTAKTVMKATPPKLNPPSPIQHRRRSACKMLLFLQASRPLLKTLLRPDWITSITPVTIEMTC